MLVSTRHGRRRRSAALVALVSGSLLSAALVALPPAAAEGVEVSIRPADPANTAVQHTQRVLITGTAPAGRITDVRFIGVEVDGDVKEQAVSSTFYDSAAIDPFQDYLRNDQGRLNGQLTLPCLFGVPSTNCSVPHEQVLTVALEVRVQSASGRSGTLRVDYTRPEIREPALVGTSRVRVRFSEPVRHRQGESPSDWRVTERTAAGDRRVAVLAVESGGSDDCAPGDDPSAGSSGCTRLLRTEPLDEDAVPIVEYVDSPVDGTPVPGRVTYDDFAGNRVFYLDTARRVGVDDVRPPTPLLRELNGATPPLTGGVVSREASPTLVAEGLRPGHSAVVRVRPQGQPATDVAETRATGSSVSFKVPALADGSYLLEVVARDGRNDSTQRAKATARPDLTPSSATYTVDTVLPALSSAVSQDGGSVRVTFTEPVTGPDEPRDWTVRLPDGTTRPVTAVRGSGATRTLDVAGVARGAELVYAPVGQPYVDAAGNRVRPGSLVVDGVPLPELLSPTSEAVTRSRSSVLVVRAPGAVRVEAFRDDGQGRPQGDPVPGRARGDVFEVEVPLTLNSPHEFLVRAVDAAGRTSPLLDVPRIVQDEEVPDLALESPSEGQVLAGGQQVDVRYRAADENAPTGLVRVQFSPDGGRTFVDIAAAAPPGQPGVVRWSTPTSSTEQGLLRLTATDRAGNSTTLQRAVAVDAVLPRLVARTVDARTVEVRLSEPVSGSSTALDWRVGREPVVAASQRTEDGVVVVTLTTGPLTVVGPDDRPEVQYTPSGVSGEYRDRAGQPVLDRTVQALDGILPGAPSVTAPQQPVLTADPLVRVSGRGTAGDSVELLEPSGAVAAGPAAVAADGTWTLDVRLARDAVHDLRARSVDRNGNRSATSAPVARIEQDGTDPAVTLSQPTGGTRVEPGQQVTVRWSSSDRNLQDGATLVEASTDGGSTWTTLGGRQPASGSLVWTVPDRTTSDARLQVSTTDRAGRTGRATSGALGIGAEPSGSPTPGGSQTSSPAATASSAPSSTATPTGMSAPTAPLPPLRVAAPGGSIVPGQLATVSVSGAPGTRVELRAYSRPSTTYVPVRTATLDSRGRAVWSVRPGTNTRLFVRDLDGRQADSRSAVITVRTALSLTVVRNGRRDYTFQGRILPRRAGQLITLYRVEGDGTRVLTSQLRTDATGTYRLRRVFTGSGRFGFVTRTGQNLTNAAGESNDGRARPTEVS